MISLFACAKYSPPSSNTERISVSASIFPIYDITRQIAGTKIDVHLLIKPGESPHTFEPTFNTKKNVNNSKKLFIIGHQIDDWATTIVDNKLKVTIIDSDIFFLESNMDEHQSNKTQNHKHEKFNPHYWLDPSNGIQIAKNIKEELINIDSKNSNYYEDNFQIFKKSIDILFAELTSQSTEIQQVSFITLHQAWIYYANAFNLNVVGSFEPEAAEEPSPKYLKELQDKIKLEKVSIIFSEPQLSTTSLSGFIKDNNLRIGILDPIGGSKDISSYQKLLQHNMDTLTRELKEN